MKSFNCHLKKSRDETPEITFFYYQNMHEKWISDVIIKFGFIAHDSKVVTLKKMNRYKARNEKL